MTTQIVEGVVLNKLEQEWINTKNGRKKLHVYEFKTREGDFSISSFRSLDELVGKEVQADVYSFYEPKRRYSVNSVKETNGDTAEETAAQFPTVAIPLTAGTATTATPLGVTPGYRESACNDVQQNLLAAVQLYRDLLKSVTKEDVAIVVSLAGQLGANIGQQKQETNKDRRTKEIKRR